MDHSPGFLAHVEGKRIGVHEVSVAETQAAIASDPAVRLFDVREDHEFAAAHARGATHLARGVVERDIEILVPDKAAPVYLYCGGGFRSALAADALQQMGYHNVHSVAGGWRAWEDAGAPVDRTSAIVRVQVTRLHDVVMALRAAGATVEYASGAAEALLQADDHNRVALWESARA
jgi:rhodanese-related sulfurtransferase